MYYFEIFTQRNPGMCNILKSQITIAQKYVSHENIFSFNMIFEIYTQKLKTSEYRIGNHLFIHHLQWR